MLDGHRRPLGKGPFKQKLMVVRGKPCFYERMCSRQGEKPEQIPSGVSMLDKSKLTMVSGMLALGKYHQNINLPVRQS